MPVRAIAVPFAGRGLAAYELRGGEAFTVRSATWSHRVVFDATWGDTAFPVVVLEAQDGRRIAVVEAPGFRALGVFPVTFGGIVPWPGSAVDQFASPTGGQMVGALPDVLLGPGCRILAGAFGQFGDERTVDIVSDLALTVDDAVPNELAAA